METHTGFVEEIDFNELSFLEIVGRGAFGVVSRSIWRGLVVAVKLIETESERKAFITELKTLSRVSHNNIVKLYGASTTQPVCLVMEYAEGGSLYNVLHGTGVLPNYTAGHAISWTLQCSRGVEYLHSMKPKPLVHRDLKPPNLLLVCGGTLLKICDFGTACDAHTHMTNNKGSAAWMAPEVFEGSNYSEKCDVFSWGIILWEVLSRRKPFDEIGGPAFRIMWAVHSGTRPPLIHNCPKPLEILMTRCWSSNPVERPSMSEVSRIMTRIFQFFSGAEEPLQYPTVSDESAGSSYTSGSGNSTYDNAQFTSHHTGGVWPSNGADMPLVHGGLEMPNSSVIDTVRNALNNQQHGHAMPPGSQSDNISDPASLRASSETLPPTQIVGGARVMYQVGRGDIDFIAKRFSAVDLSRSVMNEVDVLTDQKTGCGMATPPVQPPGRKHKRTGSHGTPFIMPPQQQQTMLPSANKASHMGHRRTGSHGAAAAVTAAAAVGLTQSAAAAAIADGYALQHSTTAPANLERHGNLTGGEGDGPFLVPPGCATRSTSWPVEVAAGGPEDERSFQRAGLNVGNQFFNLNQQLQPIEPYQGPCPESMAIYQKHCKLAEDYLRMESEIMFLEKRKNELIEQLEQEEKTLRSSSAKKKQDYSNLLNENEQLKLLQANLQKQVEHMQNQRPSQI